MMSHYIIIRGPAGVGKSAIAGKLAKEMNGHHISFDKIMREYRLDKIGGKSIKESNFIKANETGIPFAEKKLKKGQIVIFDGCFYHKSQIKHLIKNLPYPHFAFTLKADIKECISRDAKRKGKNKIGIRSVKAVYKLVAKFDYGVVIDTNKKTYGEVMQEIRSHLPP